MARFGEVTGIEYKTNRDGDEKKMLLQVLLEDTEDTQTVEYVQRGGEQTPPVEGSRVIVLEVEGSYKIGIAFDDDTPPDETLEPGDKKFYSTLLTPGATEEDIDTVTEQAKITLFKSGKIEIISSDGAGTIAASLKLLADGIMEINGNDDFLARFNKLKAGFDELKADHNALVATYNGHQHTETGSTTSGPLTSETESEASIDSAKIETIKTA
jgi:hypothetical protein